MFSKNDKSKWVFFLVLFCGIVVGGFIGESLSGFQYLTWLDYGMDFGVNPPFGLDLKVITLTLGFTVKINLAGIIGMIISIIIYRKL